MSAVDLFAGCGALSLGLKWAGYSVTAAVEINPGRAKTYSLNHPGTDVLQRDIRTVAGEEILKAARVSRGGLALVAGCPPCQGFSRIRRRNKAKAVRDGRNDLVAEFGRLVLETRPKAIMMENVPGLERDQIFERLLRSLRGAGYRIDWRIMQLSRYGVPQRRRRLVMVGWLGFARPDLGLLPQSPGGTVRDAIATLPRIPKSSKALHNYRTFRSKTVKDRIRSIPRNGGSRSQLPKSLSLDCHADYNGFRDVYGRMAWDEAAPTITGGCINPSKGRFLHPYRHRAISLLEAARLQSFPIWYRFDSSMGRYPIAEMIGEALPPRFASRAARFVVEAVSGTPR